MFKQPKKLLLKQATVLSLSDICSTSLQKGKPSNSNMLSPQHDYTGHANCRTPCLEDFLIVLHTINSSANTRQALSTRQRIPSATANALHTPSSIHNQLAQLQSHSQPAQTPASTSRQNSFQEGSSQAGRDTNSLASSSSTGLQTVERLSAASSIRQRHELHEPSSPAVQREQSSLAAQKQTQYRNPVFGQVRFLLDTTPKPCTLLQTLTAHNTMWTISCTFNWVALP